MCSPAGRQGKKAEVVAVTVALEVLARYEALVSQCRDFIPAK